MILQETLRRYSGEKLKVLGIYPEFSAVSWYRIISPIKHIGGEVRTKLHKWKKQVNIKDLIKEFSKYDIVVVKYITEKDKVIALLKSIIETNTLLVVDVDDDVFNIPPDNPASKWWTLERKQNFEFLLKYCDYITVSTEPLRQALKGINHYGNIAVLPNKIDASQWKPKKKSDKVIKIGWTFSKTHIPEAGIIREVITEVKKRYKNKVQFEIVSGFFKDALALKPVKFKDYPETMCKTWNWHISIAPLADNHFNRCKSNIKWLESTMAGCAFIGSRVYPYDMSIEDGRTGLLAGSKKQWINALSRLIEDKEYRKKLQKNAYEKVIKDYNILNDKLYEDTYKHIVSS